MSAEQISLFDTPGPGEIAVPEGAQVGTCRSCGAAIVWSVTSRGNPIPINAVNTRMVGGQRYGVSHFATCPDAKKWRNVAP
jgi:hypothetical protein